MGRRSITGISKRFFCPESKRAPDFTSLKKCLFDWKTVILERLLTPIRALADVPRTGNCAAPAAAAKTRSWGEPYTILGCLVKPFFLPDRNARY
jgi:hypothetical protein